MLPLVLWRCLKRFWTKAEEILEEVTKQHPQENGKESGKLLVIVSEFPFLNPVLLCFLLGKLFPSPFAWLIPSPSSDFSSDALNSERSWLSSLSGGALLYFVARCSWKYRFSSWFTCFSRVSSPESSTIPGTKAALCNNGWMTDWERRKLAWH